MICVAILAHTMKEFFARLDAVGSKGDLIECRLDAMEDPDPGSLRRTADRPMIFTCRRSDEGGFFRGNEGERIRLLERCFASGAEYVDVECRTGRRQIERLASGRGDTKLILSWHDPFQTPPRRVLEGRLRRGMALGADIVKIVTLARAYEDNLRVLELIPKAREKGQPIVAFCMGQKGRWGRVFSYLLGSTFTYVSIDEEAKTAPGQITLEEMEEILRRWR